MQQAAQNKTNLRQKLHTNISWEVLEISSTSKNKADEPQGSEDGGDRKHVPI
jgi:hypothetical protein